MMVRRMMARGSRHTSSSQGHPAYLHPPTHVFFNLLNYFQLEK
jgi:hypothetical protein